MGFGVFGLGLGPISAVFGVGRKASRSRVHTKDSRVRGRWLRASFL